MNKTLARARDGYTYAGETNLTVMTCPCCGITYAIPARLQESAQARGNREIVWFCPNGHELGYSQASEQNQAEQRAEREANRAARLQAQLDQTEAALRGQKSRATRFKNDRDRERRRTAAGVCPCCGRTFQQLARHMKGQHPDFPAVPDAS